MSEYTTLKEMLEFMEKNKYVNIKRIMPDLYGLVLIEFEE